ncbi:MAG: 50S ribosomal protein L19 [Planctomycetota bacterium]
MVDQKTGENGMTELKGQDLIRAIEDDYRRDDVPEFSVGDTVQVGVTIEEGDTVRVQNFTGTCIGRRGTGARETFTVRRVVAGEGVERIFPIHCPTIDHITVERRGKARRAKLNYLRERTGRSAKVKERRVTTPSE